MKPLVALITILNITVYASPTASVASLAGPNEPGARLVVSGRVFDESGAKPAGGVILYAYQTDAKGVYHPPGQSEPRLRAWVRTDPEGRFELRTIRPGSYPGTRNPAHIHIQIVGGGWPKQWADEVQFADDPLVTAPMRAKAGGKGKFNPIVTTTRDAKGVLHAHVNIRLSRNPH